MLLRRLAAAAAIVGLGLVASGCAQSMSEFARNADQQPTAYPAPGDPQTMAGARPAVLVDESTVPLSQSKQTARSAAPMTISPPQADVASVEQPSVASTPAAAKLDPAIAPSANNLNQVPAQPKSKLLTPDEKAKVIAELEALAKKQSATLDKSKKSTACASDNLDPAQRVASATGDGGC